MIVSFDIKSTLDKSANRGYAFFSKDKNRFIAYGLSNDYRSVRFPQSQDKKPGQKLIDWVTSELWSGHLSNIIVHKNKKTNICHPRIWRPYCYDSTTFASRAEMIAAYQNARILVDMLHRISLTVEPNTTNLKTFGYEIRNLLLLACTEVEAQFKAILRDNGYVKKHMDTHDYVKLKDILKLDSYKGSLHNFPKLVSRTPFLGWTEKMPSKSLRWYEAYNLAKHDSIKELRRAAFGSAIDAVIAYLILLRAQFGPISEDRKAMPLEVYLSEFVAISFNGHFDIEELYLPEFGKYQQKQQWVRRRLAI